MAEPVDLSVVLARFDEPWSPRTVAVLNEYDIRVVKTKGSSPATAISTPTRSSSSSAGR